MRAEQSYLQILLALHSVPTTLNADAEARAKVVRARIWGQYKMPILAMVNALNALSKQVQKMNRSSAAERIACRCSWHRSDAVCQLQPDQGATVAAGAGAAVIAGTTDVRPLSEH